MNNYLIAVPWDHSVGGVAYVVGNIAEYFQELGNKVLMAFPGTTTCPERTVSEWGIPAVNIRLRSPVVEEHPVRSRVGFAVFFPATLAAILLLIRRRCIDVVNIHYPVQSAVYYALASQMLGKPLVVSVHGSDLFPDGKIRAHYPLPLRIVLWCASRIVCPSAAFRSKVLSEFPEYEPKTMVVHNGIDIHEFQEVQGQIQPPGPEGGRFLCVAAQVEKKGIDVLLRAMSEMKSRERHCHLTLVGSGPLREAHEAMARELDIWELVYFKGTLGRREVICRMRGASALVVPSRSEPFGLVAAEAMLAGTPVVASRVGGLQETIVPEETGFLVDPNSPTLLADALEYVLQHPDIGRKMGQAGQERVLNKFSAQRTGDEYNRLFHEVLSE